MYDTDRTLNILYCEDVRIEITGQTSIIGIFNTDINVPTFPVTLPKFCVSMEIGTPVDQPLKELRLIVEADSGEVLIDQNFPAEILTQQASIIPNLNFEGFEERKLGFRTQFFVTPLVLSGPTMIRSKIITEKGEVRGRAMRVAQGQLVPQFGTVG